MAQATVRSVCPYCGVGCGLVMTVEDDRIIAVSGDKAHPSNRGRLCTKGMTAHLPVVSPGRLDKAWARPDRASPATAVALETAIEQCAQRLRDIIDTHGPDAVALYVSGQMSLEAQYLANKLAKGFIRTRHIESNSRLCMASASTGYKQSLGADGPPGAYDDFDHADLFFVSGANMADCHPILFLRLLDRRKAGAKLIVVDPRRTATAEKADLFLQLRPGTDLALLNGLLFLLQEEGRIDQAFIAQHCEGWETMPEFLADYPPARVAAITGVAEADLRLAARWIGENPNWMSCWTMGLNQSVQGTWHTNALCNLHLATGAICRPGAGPFSLTGQPNAMGGREMGYMGPGLPGQRSALVAADRAFSEARWGLPSGHLRTESGEGTVGLFEAMAQGEVKACWIICTNPVASVANRNRVIEGLKAAELVISQDAFLDTETNAYADILLPGALWAEADGVMVNSERNLTLATQAVTAPGDALADWQLIARVACAMGYGAHFSYTNAAEVFEEIRGFANPQTGYDLGRTDYEQLRQGPVQWPIQSTDIRRNPIRYLGPEGLRFPTPTGRARFLARPHLPSVERPDQAFPWVLNTGRLQHQWHTLTKTSKVPALNRLNPGPFVEIHPEDAVALGIAQGDRVRLSTRRGQAELPALVSDRVRPGNCFAPFHWSDVHGEGLAVNALTQDAVDADSLQPAFKYAAVRLERVGPPAQRVDEAEVAPVEGQPLLLWGSQTGTAQALAERLGAQLTQQGLPLQLKGLHEVTPAHLRQASLALLVTSTFGDGEAPDNAANFWAALQNEEALANLRYAVLALGDPSYDAFCGFGRRLDEQLQALGATALVPRQDCHGGDSARSGQWLRQLCQALALESPLAVPVPIAEQARQAGYDRCNPLSTRLLHNRLLSGPGATKETRQLVFDLSGSGLTYKAGDALGIWPENCPALVEEFLISLGLDGQASWDLEQGTLPLAEALRLHLDISRVTPQWLAWVASASGDSELQRLLAPDNKTELQGWLWGRQLVDLLQAYSLRPSLDELRSLLKPLQPRLYSISSSAAHTPDEVQITVSTVRYRYGQQARHGVASGYLADRASASQVRLFIQPSARFHIPENPDTPVIMVGPGTGVAPFRGFLHERQAQGARGRNWLVFGEQYRATDFYYREELEGWLRSGHLTHLDTAFSRDQDEKVYVQHRLLEQGARLWQWLEEGASFYVCGDAQRMAKDVQGALLEVIQRFGGLSATQANDYLGALGREHRYLRDVY